MAIVYWLLTDPCTGLSTSLSLFAFMHWRRKRQPTPAFLAGESQGWLKWLSSISGSTGLCCYCSDLKMFASSFNKPLSILIPYTLMQSHLNSCPERICTRSFGILNQLFFLSPFHLSCPYSLSLPPQVFLMALLLWAHSMVLKGSISPHTKITSIWARVLSAHMLCLHLAHKLLFFFHIVR